MAISSVVEVSDNQNGRDDLSGRREYTRTFLVQTDSAYDGPYNVKRANGIPVFGEFYRFGTEIDTQALVADINAERVDDTHKLWRVEVNFSTEASNGSGGTQLPQPEPYNLAPEIEWGFTEFQSIAIEHFSKDRKTGRNRWEPILNSARDFFDPPVEKDDARLTLKITKNQASYDPIQAYMYANAINSDSWYGFPPLTVMCKPAQAQKVVDKGIVYWKVHYEFHFNFDTWIKKVVDAGLRDHWTEAEIDLEKTTDPDFAATLKQGYNHIVNDDGTFVTEPALLDGLGHRLVRPGKSLQWNEAQPVVLLFHVYRELPFTPLNLP